MPSGAWSVAVDPSHLYFVTTGAIRRKLLFQQDVTRRILVDSLNTGRILGHYKLYAFVIMPNHVHVILQSTECMAPGQVVGRFKQTTSNLILRHFEAVRNTAALDLCLAAVEPGEPRQRGVWALEYQAKNVYSPAFLRQKLDYIHQNPVQPQWQLARVPEDYVWSSARFYAGAGRALIPLSDARELL
jgi:putative transposase